MSSPIHRNRAIGILVGAACILALLGALWWNGRSSSDTDTSSSSTAAPSEIQKRAKDPGPLAASKSAAPPAYVGGKVCSTCHQAQSDAHAGSDHDRAIEVPSRSSVLAPFSGESFSHDGTTSTFHREGDQYSVRTAGPDGKKQDYAVAYTFGYAPLQQYLLDMGQGRLQALTVAWDSRPKTSGGQRYFSLYPDERLAPTDELHWSQPTQNWNFTCADCHTTALKKGYSETKNTFTPTFAELDVSCEACHGPGSAHVEWAGAEAGGPHPTKDSNKGLLLSLKRAAQWEIPAGARSAVPRPIGDNLQEVETCAPCHSRRQQLREGRTPDEPYLDAYLPELLTDPLYQPDGQILGEVYEYGSFLQSRMFHSGVRCSDCHEPHSLELRRPGNSLCTGCHSESTFDVAEHHHHQGTGSACVDCHMPETTYMEVDPRRDHSIRVPRPDLGSKIGTQDPCTGCHKNKDQGWAASQIQGWTGREPSSHYGVAFQAARQRVPGGERDLIRLAQSERLPAIVRGTALSLLSGYPGPAAEAALVRAVESLDPLLRIGVAQAALGFATESRMSLVRPLLKDSRLGVRTAAARALVGVPSSAVSAADRAVFLSALAELEQTERYNADRADAWLRIALINMSQGKPEQAVLSLERALALDPRFVPALVNLADLFRAQKNEAQAELLLRRAIGIDEKNAEAWHALGLCLVRQQRMAEGIALLKRASDLRPESARMAYVYAVALGDGGDIQEAISVLRLSLSAHPHDPTLIQTLLNYAHKGGDAALVQEMAERLVQARALSAGQPPAQ